MNEQQEQLKALTEMRDLMNRSSRFLSLSGLSGVFAGVFALCGAYYAYWYMQHSGVPGYASEPDYLSFGQLFTRGYRLVFNYFPLFLDAALVILFSIAATWIFSSRKAKKAGVPFMDKNAWRVLVNLGIPLATGGIFCFALLLHGINSFVAPATLIFYGLALLNASKYTLNDIRYLGIIEIVIGVLSMLVPGYGLITWALGFGVMHIVYGIVLWSKYER